MITYWVLDENGEAAEVVLEQWAMTDRASQVVQQDRIGDMLVSTALIGIDYGVGPWETMIFRNGNPADRQPAHTKADALAYHHAIVAILRTTE